MLEKPMLMEMLRRMLRIRHFEEAVINMVERGEIVGAAHSYIGEEAVAVGACMALRDDDWMTGNHRSHGHPIASSQIRVEVSSSNFPRFDRNTNTGTTISEEAEFKPALQTVLHNAQHPSHITLPIVPR